MDRCPVQSLALRTNLMFSRFEGEVLDRGEYVVVRTPSNPTFFWGNYLIFADAPSAQTFPHWEALFQREFAWNDASHHRLFTWDAETLPSDWQDFAPEYRLEEVLVMMAEKSAEAPAGAHEEVQVRPLYGDAEWERAARNQLLSNEGFDPTRYEQFKRRQMANYRAMAAQGFGAWYGAFLGDELVGDLGVFFDGAVGRFQCVETHPDFRNQGVCRRLVHETVRRAFADGRADELIIVADAAHHSARVYEKAGFIPKSRGYSLVHVAESAAGEKKG